MTPDRIDHYRTLLKLHASNADPLLMVRTSDLRELLDCWQWYMDEKPCARRREHELFPADKSSKLSLCGEPSAEDWSRWQSEYDRLKIQIEKPRVRRPARLLEHELAETY
tara:strand:- start:319 stop:648 length:330 start_codon:yes stop_codon:yes gene_type:complete